MSCVSKLTQAIPLDCADNRGGIQEIYIANTEDIDTSTIVAGEVTVLTQVASTNFYTYGLEEEDADFICTETKSIENGTTFYETILNFTINKLTKEKNVELQLLAAARRLCVMWKDNNGDYMIIGLDVGAKKMGGTNQSASGKTFGDATGYTLGLMAKESHYPYFVDPSIIAGLSIS